MEPTTCHILKHYTEAQDLHEYKPSYWKLDTDANGDAIVVKPVTTLEQKNGLAEKYFSPTYQSECFQWQSEIHKRHGPARIHRKVLG